jgi:ABC-type bacteriocin/lantibiotic exporter with double-glycine peptidase domain
LKSKRITHILNVASGVSYTIPEVLANNDPSCLFCFVYNRPILVLCIELFICLFFFFFCCCYFAGTQQKTLQYRAIEILDVPETQLSTYLDEAVQFMREGSNPDNDNAILVHWYKQTNKQINTKTKTNKTNKQTNK